MITVFLVEDEYVIREGIKNNIDWTSHGFIFAGEASDGELALPQILKERPDIVITDIKMPFMNGLELSRQVKKELPETEIIILSGYEEFEYAKEAIRIGVSEYLLKPITGDEVLKHVGDLAGKIVNRRREKEMFETYQREMEENYVKERRELFDQMVAGSQSVSGILDTAGRLNLDITAARYNIFLFKATSTRHEQNEFSHSEVSINEQLAALAKEQGFLLFERDPEGKAVLMKADSEEELKNRQQAFIDKLLAVLAGFPHIRYFGGIGTMVSRLGELPSSFEQSQQAFAHRYLLDENRILDARDIEKYRLSWGDDFNISSVSPTQLDRKKVAEFLKLGEATEVKYFVTEYFRNLGSGAANSILFRQYITMDMYFSTVEFIEGLGRSRDEIEAMMTDGSTTVSIDSTMEYLCRILRKALELRDSIASNRYDSIVEMVAGYVEENYKDDELTLSSIASYINFSPSHLSTIYRQQTGMTLIKYLTDFRLGKAKELLKCTALRSSEISAEVGYKDPHYFSYLFKKTLGMTPTQYREGIGVNEETAEETE